MKGEKNREGQWHQVDEEQGKSEQEGRGDLQDGDDQQQGWEDASGSEAARECKESRSVESQKTYGTVTEVKDNDLSFLQGR